MAPDELADIIVALARDDAALAQTEAFEIIIKFVDDEKKEQVIDSLKAKGQYLYWIICNDNLLNDYSNLQYLTENNQILPFLLRHEQPPCFFHLLDKVIGKYALHKHITNIQDLIKISTHTCATNNEDFIFEYFRISDLQMLIKSSDDFEDLVYKIFSANNTSYRNTKRNMAAKLGHGFMQQLVKQTADIEKAMDWGLKDYNFILEKFKNEDLVHAVINNSMSSYTLLKIYSTNQDKLSELKQYLEQIKTNQGIPEIIDSISKLPPTQTNDDQQQNQSQQTLNTLSHADSITSLPVLTIEDTKVSINNEEYTLHYDTYDDDNASNIVRDQQLSVFYGERLDHIGDFDLRRSIAKCILQTTLAAAFNNEYLVFNAKHTRVLINNIDKTISVRLHEAVCSHNKEQPDKNILLATLINLSISFSNKDMAMAICRSEYLSMRNRNENLFKSLVAIEYLFNVFSKSELNNILQKEVISLCHNQRDFSIIDFITNTNSMRIPFKEALNYFGLYFLKKHIQELNTLAELMKAWRFNVEIAFTTFGTSFIKSITRSIPDLNNFANNNNSRICYADELVYLLGKPFIINLIKNANDKEFLLHSCLKDHFSDSDFPSSSNARTTNNLKSITKVSPPSSSTSNQTSTEISNIQEKTNPPEDIPADIDEIIKLVQNETITMERALTNISKDQQVDFIKKVYCNEIACNSLPAQINEIFKNLDDDVILKLFEYLPFLSALLVRNYPCTTEPLHFLLKQDKQDIYDQVILDILLPSLPKVVGDNTISYYSGILKFLSKTKRQEFIKKLFITHYDLKNGFPKCININADNRRFNTHAGMFIGSLDLIKDTNQCLQLVKEQKITNFLQKEITSISQLASLISKLDANNRYALLTNPEYWIYKWLMERINQGNNFKAILDILTEEERNRFIKDICEQNDKNWLKQQVDAGNIETLINSLGLFLSYKDLVNEVFWPHLTQINSGIKTLTAFLKALKNDDDRTKYLNTINDKSNLVANIDNFKMIIQTFETDKAKKDLSQILNAPNCFSTNFASFCKCICLIYSDHNNRYNYIKDNQNYVTELLNKDLSENISILECLDLDDTQLSSFIIQGDNLANIREQLFINKATAICTVEDTQFNFNCYCMKDYFSCISISDQKEDCSTIIFGKYYYHIHDNSLLKIIAKSMLQITLTQILNNKFINTDLSEITYSRLMVDSDSKNINFGIYFGEYKELPNAIPKNAVLSTLKECLSSFIDNYFSLSATISHMSTKDSTAIENNDFFSHLQTSFELMEVFTNVLSQKEIYDCLMTEIVIQEQILKITENTAAFFAKRTVSPNIKNPSETDKPPCNNLCPTL